MTFLLFDFKALKLGISKKPDIISIDGGSTDSGPASLGSGTSKYSRAAIKSEWKILDPRKSGTARWLGWPRSGGDLPRVRLQLMGSFVVPMGPG